MAKRKKPSPPQPGIDPKYVRDSLSREEFYRGKEVALEEWFVNDIDLVTWARLRVLDDGTADVWERDGTISGFGDERCARNYIGEGHYVDLRELATCVGEAPRCQPPMEQASATDHPFRYYGSW